MDCAERGSQVLGLLKDLASKRGLAKYEGSLEQILGKLGTNLAKIGEATSGARVETISYMSKLQLKGSKALARREIFEYIEVYYNNWRLHSALDYQTPRQFEAGYSERRATPFQNA